MPVSDLTLVSELTRAQNRDGGWGYRGGSSWTEPAALALLALLPRQEASSSVRRGLDWLQAARRPDGGWSPSAVVRESTWVTALAVLVLARARKLDRQDPAVRWLLRASGRESTWIVRLRARLLGARSDYRENYAGWPWYPNTAGWVVPTALTLAALRRFPEPEVQRRIEEGQKFLLSRACRDGGWNHGSSRALGYESDSYPETTGIALLGLKGLESPVLTRALTRAEEHLRNCRSVEAACWLRLGLMAHSRPAPEPDLPAHRTLMDNILSLLARSAESGRHMFL